MNKPERKKRKDAGQRRNATDDIHFSIRLNPGRDPNKYPDKIVAEILRKWLEKIGPEGQRLTIKEVFCMGILALEGVEMPGPETDTVDFEGQFEDVLGLFDERLDQFETIVKRLEKMGIEAARRNHQDGTESGPAIDKGYLANLKKALRGNGE